MVVTCPNCRSRYAVDPLKIGPAGRTVECARCHHQWHQKVEGPPPAPELVIRPTTTGASLPAVIPPKPAFPWRRAVAVGVVVVVLIAAVLFVFRGKIADHDLLRGARLGAGAGRRPRDRRLRRQRRPGPLPPRPRRARRQRPSRGRRSRSTCRHQLDRGGRRPLRRARPAGEQRPRAGLDHAACGSPSSATRTCWASAPSRWSRDRCRRAAALTFSQVIDNPPAGTTDIVPAVE